MWFYPVPPCSLPLASVYLFMCRKTALKEIRYALVILILGILIYLVRLGGAVNSLLVHPPFACE